MKLKKSVKIFLIFIITLIPFSIFSYNKYQEYLYTQSNEYKLLEIGYDLEDIKLIEKNQTKFFLENEFDDFALSIIKEKYYIESNFEEYLKYKNKNISHSSAIAIVNVGANHDFYDNVTNTDISKNDLILVNKYNKLSSSFVPKNLITIPLDYSWGDYGTQKTESKVFDAFLEMHADALKDEIYLLVSSSYRTYESQKSIYDNLEKYHGERYADSIAARPGHSEHQTGLALDIFSKESSVQKTFHTTETFEWLKNNSYKFGFILRYPEHKENITGFAFESWHYRYVGKNIAKIIFEDQITFDEYYAYYIKK